MVSIQFDECYIKHHFEVSFRLHSTWVDERLTYADLKHNTNMNTLTEKEKEDIWTPNIVFSNTKSQNKVIKDTDAIARISRFGSFRVGGREEAIRAFYFKGSENPQIPSNPKRDFYGKLQLNENPKPQRGYQRLVRMHYDYS